MKRPQEVIALGKRIVEELELDESTETLSKWLSHYLAELIAQAETELDCDKKDLIEQKCCKLIMELWAHRSNLPVNAKPTGHFEEVLLAIRKMEPINQDAFIDSRSREKELNSIWLNFAYEAYTLERKVWLTALLAGLMEANFGREQLWIDNHDKFLDDEERKLINTFKNWLASSSVPWPSDDETFSEDREKLFLEVMEKSLLQLSNTIEKLKKELQNQE